jgi:4-carboxymuconolactone decarboxylase
MNDEERRAAGLERRRAILGDPHVDRAMGEATELTAEFQDLLTRYAWGEIWTRPGLDERSRRVLVIGTLLAGSRWEEFRLHVRAALTEGGFTAADVKEIILQQSIYCGVPAANTAFVHFRELLESLGRDR